MKQKVDNLTGKEEAWVAGQLDAAASFVEAYSPGDAGQPLSLAALDRAFAAWLATNESNTELINGVINCVGVAFGQFLVDGLGLKWVIATDAQGSDLAVYGLPRRGDVLVYPATFVAKRWERRETHFLEASYRRIAEQVASLRRANAGEEKRRPWWKFW
jgi:hypothetical protein